MRAVKTCIGFLAILGIPAWVYLGFLLTQKLITRSITFKQLNPSDIFFLLLTPLYAIRMLILPDETEYIYFWAIICLLWLIRKIEATQQVGLLILFLALPNVIQLYFFQREPNGELQSTLGFTTGILEQERQKRLLNEYVQTEFSEDSKTALTQVGCAPNEINSEDIFLEKFPYHYNSTDHCILTSMKWYIRMRDVVFPSQGLNMKKFLTQYDHKLLIHPLRRDRGWRRFIRFYTAYPIKNIEFIDAKIHI